MRVTHHPAKNPSRPTRTTSHPLPPTMARPQPPTTHQDRPRSQHNPPQVTTPHQNQCIPPSTIQCHPSPTQDSKRTRNHPHDPPRPPISVHYPTTAHRDPPQPIASHHDPPRPTTTPYHHVSQLNTSYLGLYPPHNHSKTSQNLL